MIVDATRLHPGVLVPPPSKSDAHRAFTLAWMLGLPEPRLAAWPDDVKRLAAGLRLLGTAAPIDCGDGAAPFRILVALAATLPGRSVFTGTARLAERPHAPLFQALGLECSSAWPLQVQGREPPAAFTVECALSSQYASALTLTACHTVLVTGRPCEVHLEGPTASRGYLQLTLRWARLFGFDVGDGPQRITVRAHRPVEGLPPVPPDWSSLGYLLLMAKASGAEVDLRGATEHPDRSVLEQLHGGPIDARVADAPDLAPTLAALVLSGERPGVLREVFVLRHKESDRLQGIIDLAAAVGGTAALDADTLHLHPPRRRPASFRFDCRGDHRLTLSAVSLACLLHCRAELMRTHGVDKSFPGFFEQAALIGVRCEETPCLPTPMSTIHPTANAPVGSHLPVVCDDALDRDQRPAARRRG